MSAIFVTGAAGSGKTTLAKALKKKGYTSYNMDEGSHNQRIDFDGRPVDRKDIDMNESGWRQTYPRVWKKDVVSQWIEAARANLKPVFFCGVSRNQEEWYQKFDKLILLKLNPDTMIQRITERDDNNYGKDLKTQQGLLANLDSWQNEMASHPGITIIDAAQPIEEVADEVLQAIK